mgnify:FL=1
MPVLAHFLRREEQFTGGDNSLIDHLALARQRNSLLGAVEELAPQLPLQVLNGAGDAGLGQRELLGRSGNAAVFGYVVEDLKVLKARRHRRLSQPYEIYI